MDHVKSFHSKILLSIYSALRAEWESSMCIKMIRDSPPDLCSLMGSEILHPQAGYYISYTLYSMLLWCSSVPMECPSTFTAFHALCCVGQDILFSLSAPLACSRSALLPTAAMISVSAGRNAKTEAHVNTEISFVPRVSASKISPSRQ